MSSPEVLYRFDPETSDLGELCPVGAEAVGVVEKQIERAVALCPQALFRARTSDQPVLVVKTSVAWRKMPDDLVAVDGQGRLVLVECKRGWASRDALAQLLDYAADYDGDAFGRLEQDWASGHGKGANRPLIEEIREFADDPELRPEDVGREHVLVVLAAGRDEDFNRVAGYLERRGVPVKFSQLRVLRDPAGVLFIGFVPIELTEPDEASAGGGAQERAWFINTCETYSPGAWERFLARGVAAIWGYETGGAPLQQGVKAGDPVYAYRNGWGIVAAGVVGDVAVRQADPEVSVFPQCTDGNEWHLPVRWHRLPAPVSNAEVRNAAKAGLPVRNTFCRLWNADVRRLLARRTKQAAVVEPGGSLEP